MKQQKVVLIIGGKPLSIVFYLRVSTDTQSIEHQRLAVENWLTEKNYNSSQVVTFADEGISGAISDKRRPGYTKLLEGILQGKIKKVIVFETSRLSRDFMTYLNFI